MLTIVKDEVFEYSLEVKISQSDFELMQHMVEKLNYVRCIQAFQIMFRIRLMEAKKLYLHIKRKM